jgi:transcription-repair coupling factor (superfamily II helicase)
MAAKGVVMAIVATERALQPHLPPPAALAARCRSLRKGHGGSPGAGRHPHPPGLRTGAEHRAGGQLEPPRRHRRCLPVSAELPVRLEFFGEELEKLREFDPTNQRSLDAVEVVRLTPTGYAPLIADALRESMPEALEELLSA